jgi:hypothetical protein
MNQVTPVAQEAPVTLGHVKSQIYMHIYNTRISYPTATIHLGLADVSCITSPRQWYLVRQHQHQVGRLSGKPSKLSQKFLLTGPIWS